MRKLELADYVWFGVIAMFIVFLCRSLIGRDNRQASGPAHPEQHFSKNGVSCAWIAYTGNAETWYASGTPDPGLYPTEKEAVEHAQAICGGGDIIVRYGR
jgi:hypothetical protein